MCGLVVTRLGLHLLFADTGGSSPTVFEPAAASCCCRTGQRTGVGGILHSVEVAGRHAAPIYSGYSLSELGCLLMLDTVGIRPQPLVSKNPRRGNHPITRKP